MRGRYSPPSSADWRNIKTSSGVKRAVESAADAAKRYAESIAPVETGEYRSRFRVEETVERGRAVAHLVNDAEHAADVEWGQDRHVLSRAADYIEGGF